MTAISRRILFWTPRVLCLAFAIFLSGFALDVFSEGYSLWQMLIALMIHLVPTAIIIVILAVAWRWEWIGAVLFAAFGVAYLLMVWRHFNWILTISGPLFLIAVLFFVNWIKRAELHSPHRHKAA